jgi:hypothetical protein
VAPAPCKEPAEDKAGACLLKVPPGSPSGGKGGLKTKHQSPSKLSFCGQRGSRPRKEAQIRYVDWILGDEAEYQASEKPRWRPRSEPNTCRLWIMVG